MLWNVLLLWLLVLLVVLRLMKLVMVLLKNLSLLGCHETRGSAGGMAIGFVGVAAADAKRRSEACISQAEKGGVAGG